MNLTKGYHHVHEAWNSALRQLLQDTLIWNAGTVDPFLWGSTQSELAIWDCTHSRIAWGSHESLPNFSIQNFCGPFLPAVTKMWCNYKYLYKNILGSQILLFPDWPSLSHLPMSSAKPPTGRRQVPITNCSKRTLFSLSNSRSNCQKEHVHISAAHCKCHTGILIVLPMY